MSTELAFITDKMVMGLLILIDAVVCLALVCAVLLFSEEKRDAVYEQFEDVKDYLRTHTPLKSIPVKTSQDKFKQLPYKKNFYFMNSSESDFYRVLKIAASEKAHVVFVKVRLADLLYVPSDNKWQRNFNKIKSKHVDFVIVNEVTLKPVVVIELDGPTHLREDRRRRDCFVDDAMRSAGYKIVHVPVQSDYSLAAVKNILQGGLADG